MSSASTPRITYPPFRFSKSFAKAQIVRTTDDCVAGFQVALNSLRLSSTDLAWITNAKRLLEHEEDRVGRLLEARGFEEVRAIMGTHQYVKK